MRYFSICAFMALMIVLNFWDTGCMGDPFREGRVRDLVFLAAPMIGWYWSRKIPAFLCAIWVWAVWLWAYWGMDHYGFMTVMLPILFFYFVHTFVRTSVWTVMAALRLSYIFQACLGILQGMHWIGNIYGESWRRVDAVGTVGQETLLGSFLAPLCVVALLKWSRVEFVIGLIACYLCSSSMTMAALGGSLMVYAWKIHGKRVAAAVAASGFALLGGFYLSWSFDNPFFNTSGRSAMWPYAFAAIPEHWLGWGPGAWAGLYPRWDVPKILGLWPELHSEPIWLQFELGWPAVVLAVLGFTSLMVTTRNNVKAIIVGGLLVNSLGNSTFHYPVSALLMCIALCLPEPEHG